MRALIVGCGRLGSRVAELLLGDQRLRETAVFGMRRSQRALPEGVVALRGDVASDAFELPPDLDAVIYAVAAGERTEERYREAYPTGLGHVIDALERSGSRARVIFISSTAVYGEDEGGWVDEATDPQPSGFAGVQLLEAERRLLRSTLQGCSLRLSGLYGPARQALLRRVAAGEARFPAVGTRWMNQVHEEDAARAVAHALLLPELPAVLNVSDTRPSERREVLTWLAERMGAPTPRPDALQAGGAKRVRSQGLQDTGFHFAFPTYIEGYGSFLDARI